MSRLHVSRLARRDLFRLAKVYGWSSIFLAAGVLAGPFTFARLAAATQRTHARRTAGKPRIILNYGVASVGGNVYQVEMSGCPQFVRDLEERTNGEIRVEMIDRFRVCNQLDCVKRVQQGIIDLYFSSTQNSAGAAPYFNVLDFPYLFPSRASQYYFFYHPKSEALLRAPLRKHHGIHFLFTSCRLRGLMMGRKWAARPPIRRLKALTGLKIRVTASDLGKLALEQFGVKPLPLAWSETAGALKHGLVDGMETWASAAAAVMPEVLSQVIDLRLYSGNGHTAISAKVFDTLPGHLQDAVMESAYHTQIFCQLAGEASMVNTIGASKPQKPGTILASHNVRFIRLTPQELKKAEQLCAPNANPAPWEEWRTKLNAMAGNFDVYSTIYETAREIPGDTMAEDVVARRWWLN